MFNYTLFGLKLRSDIEFLQLVADTTSKEPDIFIMAGNIPDDILEHDNNGGYLIDQNRSWLVNRTMRMIIKDGKNITYSLKPGKSEIYLRAYLLGFGMAILCLQRGLMALHCSALAIKGRAYLITGESGSGKSTLTGVLLKNNALFLADDMTVINKDEDGTIVAQPAFPYQKLCRDAVLSQGHSLDNLIYVDEDKDKFLVPCKELFCYNKVPVGGLIFLYPHDGENVIYNELSGLANFHAFINNLFLRKLLGNKKYEPHIGQKCLEIAAQLNVCTIGRPLGKDSLSEITDKVNTFINKQVDTP